MKDILIDDDIVEYDQVGDGQQVIFLGGFCFPPSVYNIAEVPGFRITMPFISGAPYREHPPISLEDNVRLLTDFCHHKNIVPDYLIGHSWGASIALEYASLHGAKKVYAANPSIPVSHKTVRHCLRYIIESLSDITHPDTITATRSLLAHNLKKPLVAAEQIKAINDIRYSGSKGLKGYIACSQTDKVYTKEDYQAFFNDTPFPSMYHIFYPYQGHNWIMHDTDAVKEGIYRLIERCDA